MFCIETVCVADVFTVTLPNVRLPGETAIAGAGAGCPVPLKATVDGDVGASLTIEILPVLLPAADGANVTVRSAEAPAMIVAGMLIPFTLYPLPPATADWIVRLAFPVFCTVTVFVPDVPTVTFPKLKTDGLSEITGEAFGTPLP